jgi:hypothetical protein
LLQNEATLVNIICDIANDNDLLDNASGYTVDIVSLEVTPLIETFTVPNDKNAFPDISVIKLVSSRSESFLGSGQNIIKLPTGTIYRKMILYVTDTDGVPFEDSDITSNIDLVFNQADTNYSYKAESLAHLNNKQLGYTMPKGMYVFDFTYQGFTNYGGVRDYIDTEKLTEFWVRFNSTKAGKMVIVNEVITRLK